ncbi:MAG TPA: hypothetical protein VNZ22_15320, partial [Bacillota bacterium]|nr:hypothetical protein [Bacillota bacterium]
MRTQWILGMLSAALSLGMNALAADLNVNSGFEDPKQEDQLESLDAKTREYYAGTTNAPFKGWVFGGKWEKGGYSVAVSDQAHSGKHSAQIT